MELTVEEITLLIQIMGELNVPLKQHAQFMTLLTKLNTMVSLKMAQSSEKKLKVTLTDPTPDF